MQVVLEGKPREDAGRKHAKRLRRDGEVPCNLYGGEEQVLFSAPYNSFNKIVYTDRFQRIDLQLNGKSYPAVVKDIQFDPVTDRVIHIDFQELVEGKPVITDVPVKMDGFARGVRDGGQLQLKTRKLTLKALPKDLPDDIIVDVTELDMGKSVKVRDINIPNCEIQNSGNVPVAQVVIPRALKGGTEEEEAAAAEAAEAEAAEGAGEGGEGEAKKEGEGKG